MAVWLPASGDRQVQGGLIDSLPIEGYNAKKLDGYTSEGLVERLSLLPSIIVLALCVPSGLARGQVKERQPAGDGFRFEEQGAARVPDKEKLSRSSDAVKGMQETLSGVLKKVESARMERDIVKLNCLNDKLTQFKALLKIAEQSYMALEEAVARGAEDGAQHEFAKIGIVKERVRGLQAESEQCVGQLAYGVDENTVVTVETPEGLPDVATNPPVVEPSVINPVVLSPTQ